MLFQKQVKESAHLSARYAYGYEYRWHKYTSSNPTLLFYNWDYEALQRVNDLSKSTEPRVKMKTQVLDT